MRRTVDWRELYASNRAVIERAHGLAGLSEQTTIAAGRTRRALVHTPANGDPGIARPLVCMLHGCTQDAATFAAATRMNDAADRHGFMVVYPQQERGENAQRCWNWFDGRHQARGAGEPASIAAVVRDLVGTTTAWAVDSDRVFVAGLSAGGAMAAILAATYPDLFAAVAVHSGLAYRAAGSVPSAFAAMARGGRKVTAVDNLARPVASLVIHGSDDRTVAPVNGDQVLAQTMAANRLAAPGQCALDPTHPTTTSRGRVEGGHAYEHARWVDGRGGVMHEWLKVEGLGHAWSGGLPGGSYCDPRGPDATEAIWSFFARIAVDRRPGVVLA
jgi:poly(hydroxyalkanoate) depolymerase family esterase